MTENRRTVRKLFDSHVHYISLISGFHSGQMIEYSHGGCSIMDSSPPKLGEVITIALPYEDGDVKKKASVIWTTKDRFGVEFFLEEELRKFGGK